MQIQKFIKEHVNYTIIILAVIVASFIIFLAHLVDNIIWRNILTSAGAGTLTIIPTILIVDGVRTKSVDLRLTDRQRQSLRRVQHAHFTLVSKLILDLGDDISTEGESRQAIVEALTSPGTVSKKYWYTALRAILSTDVSVVKQHIDADKLQESYYPAFVTILEKLETNLLSRPGYEDENDSASASLYQLIVKAEEVIGMIESIQISAKLYSEGGLTLKAKQAHSQEVINSLLEYLEIYRQTTNRKNL